MQPRVRVGTVHFVDVLLGKIEHRLGQRSELHQLLRNRGYGSRKLARERAQRGARGVAARGIDEIGHRLGLREVELAFEEGATRELARLRKPRAGVEAGAQDLLQHHRPAVALELEHVLPGVGARRGEVECEAFVEGYAARIAKAREMSAPRRRQTSKHALRELPHAGPGNAHYSDGAAPRRRGDRRYGVSGNLIDWHAPACRSRTCAGSAIAARWKGCC